MQATQIQVPINGYIMTGGYAIKYSPDYEHIRVFKGVIGVYIGTQNTLVTANIRVRKGFLTACNHSHCIW